MKRDVLIFWRNEPVDVELGAFEYITQNWGNRVIFVCFNDFAIERNQCEWSSGSLNQIILQKENSPESTINEFMNSYQDAINIFFGFRGKSQTILKKLAKQKRKICIIAERPSFNKKNIIECFLKILVYLYYCHIFNNKINIFFALGQKGVNSYKRFGIKATKLFPFMYNRKIVSFSNSIDESNVSNNRNIKMIYIGRFASKYKGVNVLLKAIYSKRLDYNKFTLDFVGNYGPLKKRILALSKKFENIRHLGIWPSDKVISNLVNYDVCIIPSIYEGWNLVASEAINAGVGSIISDQAVSDELIKASDAGIIVKAGSILSLRNAINTLLNNPQTLNVYKNNAKVYSNKISSETVGRYFIDIIDYNIYNSLKERPHCPWL